MGILPDGNFIGAYNNASINDMIQIAGNILIDAIMDYIRHNALGIRDILESADDEAPESVDTE